MSPDALRRITDAESRSCFFPCLVSSSLFAWYVAAVEFIFNSTCCSYAAERARSEVEENTRSLSSDIIMLDSSSDLKQKQTRREGGGAGEQGGRAPATASGEGVRNVCPLELFYYCSSLQAQKR